MTPSLFLGFCLTPDLEKALQQVPTALLSHFTSGGDYLQSLLHQNKRYLGKSYPPLLSFQEIEECEAHLKSLLKRLTDTDPEELIFLPL